MEYSCVRCNVANLVEKQYQLCPTCVAWWREESNLPTSIASVDIDEYWECDECHNVFDQMIVMYCSSCNMKYCETCVEYMTETGFVECGADTEEYMCPMCFTEGLDRGLIRADFKGMTKEGMMRVQETEKDKKNI